MGGNGKQKRKKVESIGDGGRESQQQQRKYRDDRGDFICDVVGKTV